MDESIRMLDLTEKVHLKINGNLIPDMILKLCNIEVCPSAKDTLKPHEALGIANSIAAKAIETIVMLFNHDENFRDMVIFNLIANTQLDMLCDTKKFMN